MGRIHCSKYTFIDPLGSLELIHQDQAKFSKLLLFYLTYGTSFAFITSYEKKIWGVLIGNLRRMAIYPLNKHSTNQFHFTGKRGKNRTIGKKEQCHIASERGHCNQSRVFGCTWLCCPNAKQLQGFQEGLQELPQWTDGQCLCMHESEDWGFCISNPVFF